MNIASTADSPIVFAVAVVAFASWRRLLLLLLLLLRRRGGTAAVSSVNIYRIVVYTWAMKLDRINIICTFNIKFVSIHRATCVLALLLLLLFINDSIDGAPCCIDIQIMFIIIIISIIISIIWILLLLADIEYKSSFIAAGIAFAATNARFTDNFPISHWIPRDMVTIALQIQIQML